MITPYQEKLLKLLKAKRLEPLYLPADVGKVCLGCVILPGHVWAANAGGDHCQQQPAILH